MTDLNITELEDGLLVRTVRIPSIVEGLLSAAATAVFVGIAVSFVAGKPLAISLAVIAALVAYYYARRSPGFELRIDESRIVARGKVGDDLGLTRSVSVSDVQWLEYQEDTTGPETAHHPGGLYAVLKHRSVCVLPDVDERQTTSIIQRIEAKYPVLRAKWSRASSFGKHFTSLGLNDK
ncbi:MAG: hypothetical protein J0L64_19905 [Acidobacteria bacterium]|nr:hypothetical protein [Acidobacteriota bacterium]